MQTKGLLFIPDISGFTRFVTEMEIEHSRHIVQELLEILIEANQMGLEISEIEGDAILFYKFGAPPEADVIYRQIEKMFCAFHQHLQAYEHRRFCQCKACVGAIDLSLKVITHYGEFTGYTVQRFSKLIGKDVIIAHQLLKNNIEHNEYWLATPSLLGNKPPARFREWMNWSASEKVTDTGSISFHYAQLSELKNEIVPEPTSDLELRQKVLVLSVTSEFDVDIKTLFFTTAHFEFRNKWQEGLTSIDEVDHFLPGVGTRHRCLYDNKYFNKYTSSFSYDPEANITFSETDESKRSAFYFVLQPVNEQKSRLTLEFYLASKAMKVGFDLFYKKKMKRRFDRSMQNLARLVGEVTLPVEF